MRKTTHRSIVVRLAAMMAIGLSACAAQARTFSIEADADQTRQIERSFVACPNLVDTLESLAKAGALLRIRVTPARQMVGPGPFSAAVADKEILLAADWLAVQDQPFSDVRMPGGILPDNLCFDLGHLADHLARPMPHALSPLGLSALVDEQLAAESRAFLKGWTYVLEAARIANKGPLNGAQVGSLLFNLRYRFAFLGAMNAASAPKLSIAADGTIPETADNIAAIRAVLKNSSIADLQ